MLHDLGDMMQRVQIAGRKQIARVVERLKLAVDDQFVGQAAGLRALAAIGAASAPRFGREALAGVGDTERAMHKDFEIAVGFRVDAAISSSESSRASVTR